MKEDPFPDLKGNNSCKTYNFRIKAGNALARPGAIYAPRPSPEYSCGKGNPLYPIWAASFVSIILYLIHIYKIANFNPTPIFLG
jgi:hypothetical protein